MFVMSSMLSEICLMSTVIFGRIMFMVFNNITVIFPWARASNWLSSPQVDCACWGLFLLSEFKVEFENVYVLLLSESTWTGDHASWAFDVFESKIKWRTTTIPTTQHNPWLFTPRIISNMLLLLLLKFRFLHP